MPFSCQILLVPDARMCIIGLFTKLIQECCKFRAVCPFWTQRSGAAEQSLKHSSFLLTKMEDDLTELLNLYKKQDDK
jgi:hypothetical protein